MLPPNEIEKRNFPRAFQGYNPEKVDDYISFLTEQYSNLYARYCEHDKKLRIVAERIRDMQDEEESVKKQLLSELKGAIGDFSLIEPAEIPMVAENQRRYDLL